MNLPLPFSDRFDVVTNLGTAEHVFNQYQVFKSAHEKTNPGGIMIHALPNQGCYDHGFYNYHPTFVFDLSQANRYQIVTLLYSDGTCQPIALTPLARPAPRTCHWRSSESWRTTPACSTVLRRPLDDAAVRDPPARLLRQPAPAATGSRLVAIAALQRCCAERCRAERCRAERCRADALANGARAEPLAGFRRERDNKGRTRKADNPSHRAG